MRKSKAQVIAGFISKHFLPIGTIFIILFGILFPAPAVYVQAKVPVVKMCIITLFFIIGTKFPLKEIRSALHCYKETGLGVIAVLLLTPVIGTKLLMIPQFRELHPSRFYPNKTTFNSTRSILELPDFGPEEFRIGLQIFCVSPCASAFPTVVITAANGDRALTLLVAVIATIISVFTVPIMATWLIPALRAASVSFLTILPRVVLYILLPLIAGRLLRFIGLVKKFVVKVNTSLKFVTSGALLVMFWVKISQATAKGDLQDFSPRMILAVTALGTAVITSFLVMTLVLSSLLRLSKKSILAVTILSSARNSSIAIAVIENLPVSVGDKDLMFFPIIFVYLAMIVIINSFGYFMTIKKEENDIEQENEMPESKPLDTVNHDKSDKHPKGKLATLEQNKLSNSSDKLALLVNPLEHANNFASHTKCKRDTLTNTQHLTVV
ncbi:probable sodium/metabolite cotransporter BASS4, chloroplastic [Dendronephthya gigantea]|uniref:probable sodium/metabolite cotransporter BASS4, chloroplastic n=1 Tax=Dendronephthya gigantea TaxID=151771 RepID=UPI00106A9ADA|nr:probable sodium/metabolite cotransporter BASS4, chloroplastic [Dendronephthya gigantea]